MTKTSYPPFMIHFPDGPYREFPITLPSLAVAVLRLPVPMTPDDFEALSKFLDSVRSALTAQTAEGV